MMKNDEMLLNQAIKALQSDEPSATDLAASSHRLAERLGIHAIADAGIDLIDSCDDVQHLFPAYRAGVLSQTRRTLIDAHARECSACQRKLAGSKAAPLDWSTPVAAPFKAWRPQTFGWSLATAASLLVCGLFVYRAYWQVPPGVRAEVQTLNGTAYRITAGGDKLLSPGDKLEEGDHLRTSGGAHATLRLSDGSTIELNERSALAVGARGRDMTVSLDGGAMIVQAAKRTKGHLYVKTADCRVAVTGTVFSVDFGIKGSRVGVIEGAVHVTHAGEDTLVRAGDQLTTNANLSAAPVEQQISWSHDRAKYLPLLAQFSVLQHRIEQIPFPQPRYNSDLLDRMPAGTLLYISIPNLGDFLSQANEIFHDQLKQSPALQQWWNKGHDQSTAELDTLVDKLHQASKYLGDEMVVIGVKQADGPGLAIVADVKQAGLDDFLKAQIPAASESPLVILDESSLKTLQTAQKHGDRGFALVHDGRVIFSNNIATLKQVDAQLNQASSGFANGDFGRQITAAYGRGAGIIIAADVQQMLASHAGPLHTNAHATEAMKNSGIDGARYLVAEHREINGLPENHIALQFAGNRQGVASWLAAPAPIGSLQFVSPNASVAVAVLSKDPKTIADDIIAMAVAKNQDGEQELNNIETKLQINFRDDLAATLGGDFLVALDGPVLPTPSWKAIIEVNDSDRLEQTLERLATAVSSQSQGKHQHSISIASSAVDGQKYYAIEDSASSNVVVNYTFANGYMVAASTRALVMEALRADSTGDSLAHSSAFKALLPKNADENYSAIAYQNLAPVITPLLSQVSGPAADALSQLAADAKPTVICARGENASIEAASDSRLFSLDFLALESLIKLGNQHAAVSVKD
jgi:hypothetical protein